MEGATSVVPDRVRKEDPPRVPRRESIIPGPVDSSGPERRRCLPGVRPRVAGLPNPDPPEALGPPPIGPGPSGGRAFSPSKASRARQSLGSHTSAGRGSLPLAKRPAPRLFAPRSAATPYLRRPDQGPPRCTEAGGAPTQGGGPTGRPRPGPGTAARLPALASPGRPSIGPSRPAGPNGGRRAGRTRPNGPGPPLATPARLPFRRRCRWSRTSSAGGPRLLHSTVCRLRFQTPPHPCPRSPGSPAQA